MYVESKERLRGLIDSAMGRRKADLKIVNGKVVDVYNAALAECEVVISEGRIVALGEDYEAERVLDARGAYIAPGFIDSHIHIESAYVTPEEIGRLLVPHGTTTIVADPHEIVNVAGLAGLRYMLDAAKETVLDIRYMLPSCVPATPWEHAGANLDAEALRESMFDPELLGLAEFMNFPGVVNAVDAELDKLMLAYRSGKTIDGHSPGLAGKALNAYAAALIHTDHECSTTRELLDRLSRGLYILLRLGSACRDLPRLLPAVNERNSRRCLFCSDDRQPKTILSEGHLEAHLRMAVAHGLDPVTVIQMASLNAAECFRLFDRGAVAPGLRADLVLLRDLKDFAVEAVLIGGEEVARAGRYLPEYRRIPYAAVASCFNVKDFSGAKLRLPLKSERVHVIDVRPGGVVTGKGEAEVRRDARGEFLRDPEQDIVKIAVVERHQGTGNVAVALLRGYGIKRGAIALSIAHDSHNIIVVGTNDGDMALAVERLIAQGGGAVLCRDGDCLAALPLPVGGLMSDRSGEWVSEKLEELHRVAHRDLGVNEEVEPIMTLCFMSLAVIPELKLTDMGLFDVTRFAFIPVERED